jgi:hypothetical protein
MRRNQLEIRLSGTSGAPNGKREALAAPEQTTSEARASETAVEASAGQDNILDQESRADASFEEVPSGGAAAVAVPPAEDNGPTPSLEELFVRTDASDRRAAAAAELKEIETSRQAKREAVKDKLWQELLSCSPSALVCPPDFVPSCLDEVIRQFQIIDGRGEDHEAQDLALLIRAALHDYQNLELKSDEIHTASERANPNGWSPAVFFLTEALGMVRTPDTPGYSAAPEGLARLRPYVEEINEIDQQASAAVQAVVAPFDEQVARVWMEIFKRYPFEAVVTAVKERADKPTDPAICKFSSNAEGLRRGGAALYGGTVEEMNDELCSSDFASLGRLELETSYAIQGREHAPLPRPFPMCAAVWAAAANCGHVDDKQREFIQGLDPDFLIEFDEFATDAAKRAHEALVCRMEGPSEPYRVLEDMNRVGRERAEAELDEARDAMARTEFNSQADKADQVDATRHLDGQYLERDLDSEDGRRAQAGAVLEDACSREEERFLGAFGDSGQVQHRAETLGRNSTSSRADRDLKGDGDPCILV